MATNEKTNASGRPYLGVRPLDAIAILPTQPIRSGKQGNILSNLRPNGINGKPPRQDGNGEFPTHLGMAAINETPLNQSRCHFVKTSTSSLTVLRVFTTADSSA